MSFTSIGRFLTAKAGQKSAQRTWPRRREPTIFPSVSSGASAAPSWPVTITVSYVALDDFGTGQSSLSYLHTLPIQRLKIDQSFVRGIQDGDTEPPLVAAIVRMAQRLGMATIAEGIETPHQAELLRSLGCEEGQGYLFAKPMAAAALVEFCRVHREGVAMSDRGLVVAGCNPGPPTERRST